MTLLRSRILAAMAAVLFLVSPLAAFSAEVRDGQTPTNGKPYDGDLGAGWDGTSHRVFRSDPDGILRMTEEYPTTNQFTTTSVASAQPVYWCLYTTLQPFGTTWTAAPYGQRALNLTKTATGASTAASVRVYVFGSEDGFTFRPIIIPSKASSTTPGNFITGFADTTLLDTLKVVLPFRSATASYSIPIPTWLYLGRYVQLYASKADTVASSAVTLSASWAGREF